MDNPFEDKNDILNIKIVDDNTPHTEVNEDAELNEVTGTGETDDINTFIRKTQLQAQILKKLTESLSQPEGKEAGVDKSKS